MQICFISQVEPVIICPTQVEPKPNFMIYFISQPPANGNNENDLLKCKSIIEQNIGFYKIIKS
jgi:hypothetical protein